MTPRARVIPSASDAHAFAAEPPGPDARAARQRAPQRADVLGPPGRRPRRGAAPRPPAPPLAPRPAPAPLHARLAPTCGLRGRWTRPRGHVYAAYFTLEIKPDGAAQGAITWTLVKSPRENEQAKLGRTGVEHVRGRFAAGCRGLTLEGWRKDAPDATLGLD